MTKSLDKLLTGVVAPKELSGVDDKRRSQTTHEYTYGISSDPLTHFAVVFSALIHDVDHPGVPNTQLVKEGNDMARMYDGLSVAEQNSIDLSWKLLTESRYDALRRTICPTPEDAQRFRQLVVNTVLATDIVDKKLKNLRNERWDRAFAMGDFHDSGGARSNINRKATVVIEHLIQASDVAHTMQSWYIYRKWNERFFRECYQAYLNGRADRDPTIGWYQGELGFFDYYIIPLTEKLKDCGVFGEASGKYLEEAKRNRAEWEIRGQEVLSEMIENAKKENGQVTTTTTTMTTA